MKTRLLCWLWIASAPLHSQSLADGVAAIEAGRFDQAIQILSQVAKRDASASEPQFYLGLAQFRAGRPVDARAPLERAVALSPSNAQSWKILGLAIMSASDLTAATAPLQKACELAPSDEEACYYFARNLFALGHYEAARAPFDKALRATPEARAGRVHRAVALNYVALSASAQAEENFVKAVQSGAQLRGAEDPRVDYGAFLFRQGRVPEALKMLQPAAQETPPSPRANLELGRVLLHAERVAEAAACLEKTVQLEPKNFNAHLLLGRAYMMLGKTSEGERELRIGQEGWAEKR